MNLQEIKERCAKATPGPWDYDCGDNSIYSMTCFDGGGYQQSVSSLFEEKSIISDDDVEFIAHAREDVPALLGEVERLKKMETLIRTVKQKQDQGKIILSEHVKKWGWVEENMAQRSKMEMVCSPLMTKEEEASYSEASLLLHQSLQEIAQDTPTWDDLFALLSSD